jgi:ATP/maltotriose-dependent transcriptional regulator MalT
VYLVYLLELTALLERRAGNPAVAGSHLREAVGMAVRIGDHRGLLNCIEQCGYLCADAGRRADAVTLWTIYTTERERLGLSSGPTYDGRRPAYMRQIEHVLQPAQLREAQERGARMTVSAAVELAIMVTSAAGEEHPAPAPGKPLSPRERELVTLVAQGHTNAEIGLV